MCIIIVFDMFIVFVGVKCVFNIGIIVIGIYVLVI